MAELNGLRIADRKHIGLAEMLKGGVIMDVTNAEQAKIAQDAGAASVMALERVPSDIRRDGGVARMSPVKKIQEIQKAVTIPVMAKARIGHFVEAQILEALGVDYIDESEVLTPADEHFHIDKFAFRIPFVENIVWIDKRVRDLDMDKQQVLSTDQRRLEVDAFARYRVVDPLRMYLAARSVERVELALKPILGSQLRNELGKRPFSSLLSPEREGAMENIRGGLNRVARQYGVEIVDVRIKKTDLPGGTPLDSAFERMRTARLQEARSIRAEGAKQAQILEAIRLSRGNGENHRARQVAVLAAVYPYRAIGAQRVEVGRIRSHRKRRFRSQLKPAPV